MKLAFKRASGFVGNAINLLSGRRGFCHVELVFSDGMSFSSTTLDPGDGDDGVRFKDIRYSGGVEKWAFHRLTVSEYAERAMRAAAEVLEGAPYDKGGVLRFLFPWLKEHPKRYFCSEVVVTVLQAGGVLPASVKPWKVSPNALAKMFNVEAERREPLARHLEGAASE